MKRDRKISLTALLLAAVLFALPGLPAFAADDAPAGEAAAPFSTGDVTGDGYITAEDARLALRIAVGLERFVDNAPELTAADVDGEAGISASDARLILRVAVGLDKVEANGHIHIYAAEVVEPTCTEGGYTVYTCRCGDSYKGDLTPPQHHYVKFFCTVCGQMDPLHVPTAFANEFEKTLYATAHPLFYKTADELSTTGSILEYAYHRVGKWCCYYTIHDVFRPALKAAGYGEARIEQLAPQYYTADKISKVLRNSTSLNLYVPALFAAGIASGSVPVYVPSLLLDYYLTHPGYANTYVFREFYDDLVEQKIYQPTENCTEYKPRVGDILFMSNKLETYVNGYPTVDHTAQIIQMYDDGSFWCTEGSIIQTDEEDGKPRVRERMYFFNAETGTYEYRYNSIVFVLAIAQPDLYDELQK